MNRHTTGAFTLTLAAAAHMCRLCRALDASTALMPPPAFSS